MTAHVWRDFGRCSTGVVLLVVLAACGGGGGSPQSQSHAPPPSGGSSNSGPTIQGQAPATVTPGQQYSFRPTASDPNGDTLTFVASNLPSWLTINSSTGQLSGTPTAAEAGSYSNITITVSDGRESASLAAFSIVVTDAASGSATISWSAPTQNTDGSALTDLAGYEIRYGQNAASLNQIVTLSSTGLTTYVVENLSAGTWYFSVAARNAQGITSSQSEVASKVIG